MIATIVWRLPQDAYCDLLCEISDSIPLQDEIAFMRYVGVVCVIILSLLALS